jgi:hypothetical protein
MILKEASVLQLSIINSQLSIKMVDIFWVSSIIMGLTIGGDSLNKQPFTGVFICE